jgi:hypothetical protein
MSNHHFFYCGEFLPKCNMERRHVITQLSFSSKDKWISLVCDENCKREGGHLMDGMGSFVAWFDLTNMTYLPLVASSSLSLLATV